MKNINLSIMTLIMLSTLGNAGGDFQIVTPYEVEEEQYIEEIPIERVPEPTIIKKEIVVKKEPIIMRSAVVEEPKKIIKDIYANGFYAGLGIVGGHYRTLCNSKCPNTGTANSVGLIGRVGYDFNQYIGLEGRGIGTDKLKHAGVFIKPMLPIGEKSNFYGLIGLAKTTTQGKLQRTDAETLALGAGIEFDLSKDSPKEGRYNRKFDGNGDQEKGLGVFIDYEKMVVKSGAPDLDAVSAGVTYDF